MRCPLVLSANCRRWVLPPFFTRLIGAFMPRAFPPASSRVSARAIAAPRPRFFASVLFAQTALAALAATALLHAGDSHAQSPAFTPAYNAMLEQAKKDTPRMDQDLATFASNSAKLKSDLKILQTMAPYAARQGASNDSPTDAPPAIQPT